MDFLKSIIPLIERPKFIDEIAESKQLVSLFDLIRKDELITDEQAQQVLYSADNGTYAYKKLKQRLRERLMNHAIKHGIAYKNLDNYALLYRKCLQKMYAVKTLTLSNARTAAIYVAENLIRTAKDNEFTDIVLHLSEELYYYYSAVNYNTVKAAKYKRLKQDMLELFSRESIAMQHYCELNIILGSSRASVKESKLPHAIKYCDQLELFLSSRLTSYQLIRTAYLVIAMRYEIERDYEGLLKTCDRAINALNNRKVSRKVAFYLFDQRRILSHIHLKNYKKAQHIAGRYIGELTPGQINWFVLKSYVMLSYLHGREYNEATKVMMEVRGNKAYKSLPRVISQTLTVYEAHIYFLISIGKVENYDVNEYRFRLYKFLNEIPNFAKDKRGLNIAILIVHVLFLLRDKKYMDIIDRIDALNQYCHRYLRRDDTFRSNCFIKMLLRVAKADFNPLRAKRYAEPLVSKLKSMPLAFSNQTVEVEIIPYEDLWKMVLELLESE